MSATLVSTGEFDDIRVEKPILLVGRNDDCDVVLDSKKVSRFHCCIALVRSRLVVRDLGSTNGIRVNGQRLSECRLSVGDELAIGNLRFRVEEGASGAPVKRRIRPSDSQIESADDPIPLSEPGEFADLERIPGIDPAIASGAELAESPENTDSSWLNIPDDIRLASSSDIDLPLKPFDSD